MNIDQQTGNDVLDALRAANFPDSTLFDAFPQAGMESAINGNAFTSHLFVTYNNASGITWSGSDDQAATGAYDSGDQQPDGNRNYAAYPDLQSWARDFYRILNFDKGAGKPVDAASLDDYVTRLKTNGYFGDTYDRYLANVRKWQDLAVIQFPDQQPVINPVDLAAAAVAGSAVPGSDNFFQANDWLILVAFVALAGVFVSIIYYINSTMKKAVLASLLLLMSLAGFAQPGLSPQPPPNTCSYGVNKATYYFPGISCLDSLALGAGIRVKLVSGSITIDTVIVTIGLRQSTQDSINNWTHITALATTKADSFITNKGVVRYEMNNGDSVSISPKSYIIGGFEGDSLNTKIKVSDLTGLTDLDRAFIVGAVPPSVPPQSYLALTSANAGRKVYCTNTHGVVIFVITIY